MDEKAIFNATVCLIGIAILLIHSVDLLLKKGKRKDEKNLLVFLLFTIIHFATYLAFVLIKIHYTSDAFIVSFYTVFYLMNNGESLFLFAYALSYIEPKRRVFRHAAVANLALFGVFLALDFGNVFGGYFFSASDGLYVRSPTMIISQGYQLIAFIGVFILAVTSKKLTQTEKIAFVFYCILPLIAIVVQNLLPGYAIAYLSIIASIEVLYLFANMRKNAILAEQEKKDKDAQVRLMVSQIQPHFIYNTLSSISTLIPIDPPKAQKGLDDFTEYLRGNLSSISAERGILFSDELRHIETYLSLEKLRFEERLKVVYEIEDRDFLVPPLSIQPLVENAVKHGILQKIEGGTIILKSYQTERDHIVEIIDDGVGFDVRQVKDDGRDHIGLSNVRYRITTTGHGQLIMESEIGKGTKATVIFHKEANA